MIFEDLASRAGRAALDIGSGARRPPIGQVVSSRQRTHFAVWATSAVIVISFLALALVSSDPTAPAVLVAGPTSSTASGADGVVGSGTESCPVTVPTSQHFEPASETPDGPPASYDSVWFGTPDLFTRMHHEGEIWEGLPVAADGTLTQKTFWWREGYQTADDPQPDVIVTLEDLGSAGVTVEADRPGTSGAHAELGQFMIIGLAIPHEGCWRVTAEYRGASLTYVAWAGAR